MPAGKAGQYIECGGEITFPTSAAVASAAAARGCSNVGATAAVRVLAFAGLALNSHCSV